jgi:hypothetical protein
MRKHHLLTSAAIILAATGVAAAQSTQQDNRSRQPQASEQQTQQRDADKERSGQVKSNNAANQGPSTKSKASDTKTEPTTTTGASTADTKAGADKANNKANTGNSSTDASSDKKPDSSTADNDTQRKSNPDKDADGGTSDKNKQNADVNSSSDRNRNADNNRDPDSQRRNNASHRNDSSRVSINRDQETKISAAIRTTNVRPLTNVNFSISVGTVIPASVELHTLPADVVAVVPQYRGYRYFVVRDEIVIVEPSSKKIVTIINRSSGHQASTSETRTKFTKEQRETIRKSRPKATTGSSRKATTVTVGERIPDSVELYEFDDDVVRVVPSVRTYRYVPSPKGVYVVDPAQRTVIEEID